MCTMFSKYDFITKSINTFYVSLIFVQKFRVKLFMNQAYLLQVQAEKKQDHY
jgi:hypothetical protein